MNQKRNSGCYLAASVSVAAFVVYLSSLRNGFVEWDDSAYVYENVHIRSLTMAFLRWAFFDFHVSNWHPLTWISHAIDYALWGLNPVGHHLTNLILHSANAFLVVVLVMRLVKASETSAPRSAFPLLNETGMLIAGGVTGLLFALHPLHVESVAWVADRKDLLCALFFLLSLRAYISDASGADKEGVQQNSLPGWFRSQYLLSLGFFVLALLSKPMAVSLPLILLMLDWYPCRRIRSLRTFLTAFVGKLPFVALSLCSSTVTVLAQSAGRSVVPAEWAPLSTRALVAAKSLVAYLWKMLLPLNLIPFYPYPQNVSLSSPEYLLSIALVSGVTVICVVRAKRQRLLLAAWIYYVATLLPVIGIVQVGNTFMADRYSYLPSLGPFLVAALGAAFVVKKADALGKGALPAKILFLVAVVLALVSLSWLTVKQAGIWKNSITLWSYVIEKEPTRVPLAYYNRGLSYQREGQFYRAIEDYDRAAALDPSDYEALNNLGVLYGKVGLAEQAIEVFDKAILANPGYAVAYFNRGLFYSRAGNKDLAAEDYLKACQLGYDKGCKALSPSEPR